jgi:hypothetical protein
LLFWLWSQDTPLCYLPNLRTSLRPGEPVFAPSSRGIAYLLHIEVKWADPGTQFRSI